MPTALIIGASRGIGHEFVRQYRAEGRRVLATYRKPADADGLAALGAEPVRLDVNDATACVGLAASIPDGSLNVVVINAGIFPKGDDNPATLDEASFLDGMRTNVLAPMRLAGLLGPKLAVGGVVGFLSSSMASIGALTQSNALFYRSSKAALNMVVKAQANVLREHGRYAVALDPGWVKTDMGGPHAEIDAATSVAGLRTVLAGIDAGRSGGYFEYTGIAQPW